MRIKNIASKTLSAIMIATIWTAYSMVALAAGISGEVTAKGSVTVNGQAVSSTSTIVSGAVISTGEGSSASISIGSIGRIELDSSSSATISFDTNSIAVVLESGKARVSNKTGVASSVSTKAATFIGDAGQANSYLVEAECAHAHVDTTTGIVTMRQGSQDQQVAAGATATAGHVSQTGCKPCLRPGSAAPVAVAGWGALPLALLLLAAGGAVGTAVALGGDKNTTVGGGVTVVSPVR